jgi:crotonobetainyl-CoA:carnitine CoA-transferase CaiB-like acyl-CoA transferase
MEALRGIRVVDFTWAAAGPYITQLLAYMGAEVIRIESRHSLDLLRVLPRMFGWTTQSGVDHSPMFNQINVNKLSVTVNLRHPKGVELVRRLVAISDVVVENFSPGVIDRLGLGYAALKVIKPDIIMLSSSISGRHGPETTVKGYAPIMAALGGLSQMTGYPDDAPADIRGPADLAAASQAAYALMAAIYHHRKTGQGQYIDFASREAQSVLVPEALMDYAMNGRVAIRQGNATVGMAPHNCYPCRGQDRWLSIAVTNATEWAALCRVMGHPAWCRSPHFADGYQRWQHREELDQHIAAWTRDWDVYELMTVLQDAGIAAAPSMDAQQLFTDPHLRARGTIRRVQHPVMGEATVLGPPFKMSHTPPAVAKAAPLLGEHNAYVFGELLGLSEKEQESLAAEKVFS